MMTNDAVRVEVTDEVANIVVRLWTALAYEGAAADTVRPGGRDQELARAAARRVRADFDDHALWDVGLLTDEEHPPCDVWPCVERSRKTTAGASR